METISCHSNQSSYPPGIKNTNYVEATVRTCIQSTGLIPLTVSEKKIFECFSKFCPISLGLPGILQNAHKRGVGLVNRP